MVIFLKHNGIIEYSDLHIVIFMQFFNFLNHMASIKGKNDSVSGSVFHF